MSADSGYGAGGWPPHQGPPPPADDPHDPDGGRPPQQPPYQQGQPGPPDASRYSGQPQHPGQAPQYGQPRYPGQAPQGAGQGQPYQPHQAGQPPYQHGQPPQQPPYSGQGPPQQPPYQQGGQGPPPQPGPPYQGGLPPYPAQPQYPQQPPYPGQQPGRQAPWQPDRSWQQGALPGEPQPDWQQWGGGGQHRMRRRRSRKGLVLGLSGTGVVALAVVVVLFLVFWRSDADYGQAWDVPHDKAAGTLLDGYVVGDTVVRASAVGITGQKVSDGEQQWTVKPPAGQQLCGVSPTAAGNTVAYAYGRPSACLSAAAIDLRSGKVLWKARLEEGEEYQQPSTAAVALVGGIAAFSNGRVTALDLKSGERRWAVGPANTEMCRAGDAMASDSVLLAYVDCVGRAKSELDDTLVSLDPANGSSRWTAKVKNEQGTAPPSLVNVSPPVLRLEDEKDEVEYAAVDDDGKNPVVFPAFDPGYAVGPRKVDGSHIKFRLAVYGTALVGVSAAGKVVGVDVTTGKKLWEKSLGSGTTGSLVLGAGPKSKARIYTLSTADNQEWLTTVDPRTGKLTKGPVVREVSEGDVEAREKAVGDGFFLQSGDVLMEFAGHGDEEFGVRAYTPQ